MIDILELIDELKKGKLDLVNCSREVIDGYEIALMKVVEFGFKSFGLQEESEVEE